MRNQLLAKDFLPLQTYVAYGLVLWCLFVYCLHGAFVGETYIPSYRGRADRYFSGFMSWPLPVVVAVTYTSVRVGKDKFLSRRLSRRVTIAELTLLCFAVSSAWYLSS